MRALMALLFNESAIAHAAVRRSKETTFLDEWLLDEIQARLAPLTVNFEKALWDGKVFANISTVIPALYRDPELLQENLTSTDQALTQIPAQGRIDGQDLVISYQQLHHTNDVPGALLHLGKMLKPDGMFLTCFLGGQSLVELRHVLAETEIAVRGGVSPRVHPMIDLKDAAGLIQAAGFALPVVDSETVELHYSNLFALIRDLRSLGLSNMLTARDKHVLPREFWPQAAARYAQEFPNGQGGITVTLEAIFLSGWRPAATQQIPLTRGSVPLGFNSTS